MADPALGVSSALSLANSGSGRFRVRPDHHLNTILPILKGEEFDFSLFFDFFGKVTVQLRGQGEQ